jgi:hypothetical protein
MPKRSLTQRSIRFQVQPRPTRTLSLTFSAVAARELTAVAPPVTSSSLSPTSTGSYERYRMTPTSSEPMATPAEMPGAAAVSACAAMAVSYVAVLYAPTALLRLPPPTSLRAFLHCRFACAAVASVASALLRVSATALPPHVAPSSRSPDRVLKSLAHPVPPLLLSRCGALARFVICSQCSAFGRITL